MKKYLKYICSMVIIFMFATLSISCSKDKDVGLVYGNDSAPIVIENYTSFQCPDCADLHLKLKDVLKKYIDNGEVKYVEKQIDIERFKFDDLIYKRMNQEQINDFDKLTEIYEKQNQWLAYDDESSEEVIKLLNLTDTDNKKNISDLKKIKKEKEKLDIHAVPTMYLNGEEVSNKITVEEFEEKLKSLLN